jgi:hypothetical protein
VRAFIPGPARAVLAAIFAAALLCAAIVAAAPAAATVSKHATKTFTLAAGQTRAFDVPFPDALEFGGSTYSGRVTIVATRPASEGRVRVLRQSPAIGGSVYRAVVRNANPAGSAPVRVVIEAITREPAHSRA